MSERRRIPPPRFLASPLTECFSWVGGIARGVGEPTVESTGGIGDRTDRNFSPELGIRRSPWAEQGASRFDVSFLSLLSCSCSLCIVAFNSKFEWVW